MTKAKKATFEGFLWAALAVVIWSGSLVLLRLGVKTSLNGYDLTALRFGTAAAILFPVIIKRGIAYKQTKATGLVLMVGGFGAPYVILLSIAMKTAPASVAGAFNPGVMAVCSVLMGAAFFKDRIGFVRIAGVFIIIAGLVLPVTLAPHSLTKGHVLLVLTGSMWAGYGATLRKTGVTALHATAIIAVGSALFYLPVYFLALPTQLSTAPFQDILLQAGFQGVLVSTVAVFAFNRSGELLGPVVGASLPALIPLVTLLLGALLLRETTGVVDVAIALVIGFGVALILIGKFGIMTVLPYAAIFRKQNFCAPSKHKGSIKDRP